MGPRGACRRPRANPHGSTRVGTGRSAPRRARSTVRALGLGAGGHVVLHARD
ncbi:MAG: hypothetical protein ACK56I_28700 [bacterium]